MDEMITSKLASLAVEHEERKKQVISRVKASELKAKSQLRSSAERREVTLSPAAITEEMMRFKRETTERAFAELDEREADIGSVLSDRLEVAGGTST